MHGGICVRLARCTCLWVCLVSSPQDFDTVMAAIGSNNERWGIFDVRSFTGDDGYVQQHIITSYCQNTGDTGAFATNHERWGGTVCLNTNFFACILLAQYTTNRNNIKTIALSITRQPSAHKQQQPSAYNDHHHV